ncbi:uncharacterized protein [Watersipora subatra]
MTTLEELDPLYHFSTHYRDRLNLLDQCFTTKSIDKKSSRISRRKNNPRYKTQPITFDEIKEVEEPTTPSNENNNVTQGKTFLTNLHLENTDVTAKERLKPHSESVACEILNSDAMRGKGSNENIWYDSPFPSKMSFLDVPDPMHPYHHHNMEKPSSEKSKFKSRAMRRRNNPRYKTQPITFDEIQEVEEPDGSNNEPGELTSPMSSSPTIDVLINSQAPDASTTLLLGYAH